MNPEVMAADDRKRARRAPLRSRSFWRMLGVVLPHRSYLITGITASLLYAVLHSLSILGSWPVLKVLIETEGLHGWVDRSVAGQRAGLEFVVRETPDGPAALIVQHVSRDSTSLRAGLRPGDAVVGLDGQAMSPRDWLRRVATAPLGTPLRLDVVPQGDSSQPQTSHEAILEPPSVAYRWAAKLADLLPREQTRDHRWSVLVYVLVGLVMVTVVANFFRFVAEYAVGKGVLRAMMDLRRALYAKVLKLPMSHFTRDVGDLVARFVQDVQDIQRGVMSLFGKTIREPLKAAFVLVAALAMDWRLTLLMLFVAPAAVVIFWWVGHQIKKANRKLLRGYGTMISRLTETLSAIAIVKAYTTENVERLRLWKIDRKMFRQQLKIVRMDALLDPSLEVLGVMAGAAVTAWLGAKVMDHQIEPARFGALVIALGMLFDPLRKMADVYTRVSRSAAGAERLFEILDAKEEAELFPGTAVLAPLAREIEFRDVTFTYPEADQPALANIQLTVRYGETVALVGRNGSGKTTLVNLLARFYDPQEGAVLIDGVDVRTVTLRSLRQQIGLVTQDTVIFPIPLAENISYGSRNGSRESVIAAAQRAYADEFIRTKPQGYDTVPGDMGKTLSGGQKQRLAIARAILRDPPILIFDEATSQIDAESEQKIQSALAEFARHRTTFIIAHRLSTIRFAHRIVVLESGRVVDVGTHDELLARCPLYHGLCETQLTA